MDFNYSKCKVFAVNCPHQGSNLVFTINGVAIDVVKEYKYLGVIFSNRRLTTLYNKHFMEIL